MKLHARRPFRDQGRAQDSNENILKQWKSYSFRLEFAGRVVKVKVSKDGAETVLESGEPMEIVLKDKVVALK